MSKKKPNRYRSLNKILYLWTQDSDVQKQVNMNAIGGGEDYTWRATI